MNLTGLEFNTTDFSEEYQKIKAVEKKLVYANGNDKNAIQLRFDACKVMEENMLFMVKNISIETTMKRRALNEIIEEMKITGELKQ